jgi:2-oxo-4-hydroxy-4-carboxy--5-ureidoimidazoline (OHCU) decarboxylase
MAEIPSNQELGRQEDSGSAGADTLTPQELAEVRKLLAAYQKDLEQRADAPELRERLQERLRRRLNEHNQNTGDPSGGRGA